MKLSFRKTWTVILTSLALTFSAIGVTRAHAATTFTVTDCGDSGAAGQLRTLMNAAASGDTINIPACTITITGAAGEDANVSGDLDFTKSLTLVGAGAGTTIIDGGALDRVFQVTAAYTVNISGVTVRNGNPPGAHGGGIYNHAGATLTITNSVFSGNSTSGGDGGGIFNGGTLTITNSVFSGNSASGGFGGGVYTSVGTLTITNSTFSNNSAIFGGGIYTNSGTAAITNSAFSGNSATISGLGGGGGIYNNAVPVTITNSTFSGNSATGGQGGGILTYTGTLTVTNSTFSGNGASTSNGGGIYNDGGTLNLKNTILANSTSGGDCYNNSGDTITTNINNLIETNGPSGHMCGTPDVTSDPGLGTLAYNGGPTQTFALLTGSPAIDAGDDTTCAAAPVSGLDQRGIPRPQGAHCDIGAFESQAQAGPTFIVNASADTNDGSCDILGQGIGNKDCTLREAINAANAHVGADTITFSFSGTITLVGSQLPGITAAGGALTVDGTGQTVTISGGGAVRVMYVDTGASLTLNNLTIANGNSSGSGGGIYNVSGTLTIMNSTFSSNTATGGFGGGIFNGGTLTITNSTFSGNNSSGGGGGIENYGTLTITNSTFSGNGAPVGSGIYNNGGTVTLRNTIVANSTWAGNCGGDTINNGGNNIDDGTTCGWGSASGSKSTTNPLLGSLANNGGPTQTFALLTGSPAIDGVTSSPPNSAPSTDQRGVARPQGVRYDIGAFEVDSTAPTALSFVRQTPSSSPTNADTLVFRATFSEAVIGVDTADFAVNGTTTATVTGVSPFSTSVYDVTVSSGNLASFNGVVGLDFSGSPSITDLATNAFVNAEPATDQTYTLDNTAPTVAMSSAALNPTNASPIPVIVTFSESVTGFTSTDIVPTNGAVSNFAGSGASYTFDLTPAGQGLVNADIAAGVATDLAGNGNTAATQFSRTYSVAYNLFLPLILR